MARYASVEPLSQRLRRKRGTDDGLWFAVSGSRFGVDFRQSGQFARLGGRRWRLRLCGKELEGFSVRFLVCVGFGFGGEKPPPIEYREHGKLVLPPNTELPPPGSSATADPAWPVNQEILRKKALKEEGKKSIAGVGDARLRYTHGFPANEPVTVRSVDPDGQTVKCESNCGSTSSVLGNLNPLKWVGMGEVERAALGPEPDREWLTDPPKGFRAPVEPVKGRRKTDQSTGLRFVAAFVIRTQNSSLGRIAAWLSKQKPLFWLRKDLPAAQISPPWPFAPSQRELFDRGKGCRGSGIGLGEAACKKAFRT